MAEVAGDLKSLQSGFESQRGHVRSVGWNSPVADRVDRRLSCTHDGLPPRSEKGHRVDRLERHFLDLLKNTGGPRGWYLDPQ